MKRHLTEEELIQYQFKLASDEHAVSRAEHLAGCDECRRRLEQLNQKFAALDLLAEDIPASEELISQAIAQAKKPAPRRIVTFGKYRWLGTAAAALVIGFVLMMGNLTEKDPPLRELAEKSQPQIEMTGGPSSLPGAEGEPEIMLVAKGLADESVAKLEEGLASRRVAGIPAAAPPVADAASPIDNIGAAAASRADTRMKAEQETGLRDAPGFGAQLANAVEIDLANAEICQEPPFAPASAIELVTLPRRDEVQLTIYNSADLTLVRERRNLTLKRGWNWLQLMWANTLIDPTSLSLEPVARGDKIDVQQLVFPARLRDLGRWLIRSEISGQVPFEITYFTSGLTWRAFYMGTLSEDEKTMRLKGYVRVANNSGEDYENAQTRLLVGKVNVLDKIADLAKRQYAYGRPMLDIDCDEDSYQWGFKAKNGDKIALLGDLKIVGGLFRTDALRPKEITKEGLSEYFLYTIEGTETIADKWGKRLPSFDVEDIEVESLYKYDEERWGRQAIRFVSFANDAEHNLGETPIPDGAVKIYGQAGGQGHLSYVGGTNIKYIPVDEEVELNLGPARLVKVEPKLMAFETENYVFDNEGDVAGWDEIRTWEIEITNARALPIEIEITRGFGAAYWTLQTETPYEKHDATHTRFETELQPQSKQTFTYTLTTYHGRREEQVNR